MPKANFRISLNCFKNTVQSVLKNGILQKRDKWGGGGKNQLKITAQKAVLRRRWM